MSLTSDSLSAKRDFQKRHRVPVGVCNNIHRSIVRIEELWTSQTLAVMGTNGESAKQM